MSDAMSGTIEPDAFGGALLRALPCPVCGGHEWAAPLGGPAYCGVCNCQVSTRRGKCEGYVAEFDSSTCWEHQHIERIPALDDPDTGERKGRPATVKFLSVRPGCCPEWWSATAVTLNQADEWTPSWRRIDELDDWPTVPKPTDN